MVGWLVDLGFGRSGMDIIECDGRMWVEVSEGPRVREGERKSGFMHLHYYEIYDCGLINNAQGI